MTKTPTDQTPSEFKHLGYWWSCEMTAETIDGKEWAQTCDYYPRCEKCAVCGALAVAYFPVWDIDQEVPPKPYCRKFLDKAKYEFYVKLLIGK